ncbi:hypothetical protein Z517_09676 [Fonsecaea pedrosoi CBS 271.37]|uniref:non-specific serine/threonine protein kinase n=1 Tax=Fonsecaea pedrosoi CBS 271.37 TaxID=1442368 RepID=A0A0D2GF13_9EURO|nr:uncharacterized protein Z517_09676 [Fonsecaea pedrosoi CBS 271.37]KIW77230.1 hypothetical protein Z517_09676 [Fonsecaea pedrosoi CBS 271.37]
MADKTQSEVTQPIVQTRSLAETLGQLHASFKATCDRKDLSCSSDALGRLGPEELRSLTLLFLSSLNDHPTSSHLPSTTGRGCLRDDLLEFTSAVSSGGFDLECIKPLLNTALSSNPYDSTIWEQVYNAITESGVLHHQITSQPPSPLNPTNSPASSESPQQDIRDRMLDLDMSPDDCYYRLLREDNRGKRVIYVFITDNTILPEDSRTENFALVRELCKLDGWYDTWNTLTVSRLADGIECLQDHFGLHAIPPEKLVGSYPLFDVLDLRVLSRPNHRVKYVDTGSGLGYLKIARFAFEVGAISREIEAYEILAQRQSQLGPALLGYVYEGTPERIVGFISEPIDGRPASISDLQDIESALEELHACGLVHGDVFKYNILITTQGPRFIDFEKSSLPPPDDPELWQEMKEQELRGLEAALLDETGMGKPWSW